MGRSLITNEIGRPSEGAIEVREGGKFRARIQRDGKRISATHSCPVEAEQWLLDRRKDHASGNLPKHLRAKAITLSEGMDLLLADIGPGRYHDDTANKIAYLKEIAPDLCSKPLSNVTRDNVKKFIAHRKAMGRKPATINRDLTIMRSVFKKASTEWGCEGLANPLASITAGKETERDRRPTPFELEALARAASAYLADRTCKSKVPVIKMIRFTASTGLRISEVGNLTWSDVNWQRTTILVRKGKGGKSRIVPLFPSILDMLREMGGGLPTAHIFGTFNAVRRAWRAVRSIAAKECPSIEPGDDHNLRFHDLRHEAVSRLFEITDLASGAIMAISGHKDPRSMQRYTNIRNAELAPRLAEAERKQEERCSDPFNADPYVMPIEADSAALALKSAWQATSSSRDSLQGLVEHMPIQKVAAIFGVSDVAVHKACKRLGVTKYAPGHWAQHRAKSAPSGGAVHPPT